MDTQKINRFDRRSFLRSTALASGAVGLATLTGGSLQVAFGSSGINKNVFVYIFMRGGPDWLSFITPMDGHPSRGDYEALRINGTQIPNNRLLALADGWGINDFGGAFQGLFQDGDLAVVQAAGLPIANRSHFEAERFVELGTPGNRFTSSGWLARHMQTAINLPGSVPILGMAAESSITFSLLGEPSALSLGNPASFELEGGSDIREDELQAVLTDIYAQGDSEIEVAGSQALEAVSIVQDVFDGEYVPSNGAQYPDSDLGDELLSIARLIKADSGVRVAQADRGGWDTHNGQGPLQAGGYGGRVQDIADSVAAFLTDLDVPTGDGGSWKDRTSVLMMGEFGRRAFDNNDAGTDHGYAGNILVAGGASVNGGVYGTFPGLADGDLFQGNDVLATTDYRNVFSEMLLKHLGNPEIGTMLPDFNDSSPLGGYNPLGIFNGEDIQPNLGPQDVIAKNGFE